MAKAPRPSEKIIRRGRIFWIFVSALFLALVALVIWTWVRTRASEGYGAGRYEHRAEHRAENTAVLPADCPSPLLNALSSATPEAASQGTPDTVSDDEEIVYHSHRNDRMEIALSFDDGPHPRLTPVILGILQEYGIRATFFMIGENVGYYPNAARAVVEAGHEIGNHTFSHRRFSHLSEAEMKAEIHACEQAISAVSSSPVRLIRPPEGQMNEAVRRAVGALDYRIILWDVDTRDWAHTSPAGIARHILDTVRAGDIILMHDFIGHDSPTPEALRLVIPELLARGYHFVTVGELVEGDRG